MEMGNFCNECIDFKMKQNEHYFVALYIPLYQFEKLGLWVHCFRSLPDYNDIGKPSINVAVHIYVHIVYTK